MRAEERTRRKALPVPRHATLLDLSALLFSRYFIWSDVWKEKGEREKVKIIMLMSVAQCIRGKRSKKNAEKSEDKNN
jgi:hypothetical protein